MNIIKNRIKSNNGFMGPTHAMSAVAFYLLLFLFAKDFIINLGIKDNLFILFISTILLFLTQSRTATTAFALELFILIIIFIIKR